MKKIICFLGIILLCLSTTPASAEWRKLVENEDADSFFVDFERIRETGGYVYFWSLIDMWRQHERGFFSIVVYHQGDCRIFRIKDLSISLYSEPMGRGTKRSSSDPNDLGSEWRYPDPNSVLEVLLRAVCDR